MQANGYTERAQRFPSHASNPCGSIFDEEEEFFDWFISTFGNCEPMYTQNGFKDVQFMLLIHVNPHVSKRKSILTDFNLHSEHRTGSTISNCEKMDTQIAVIHS